MIKVQLTTKAKKGLKRLDSTARDRVNACLETIATDNETIIPLSGELKGLHKCRVGDYRIILEKLDKNTVEIKWIGHRREVYKVREEPEQEYEAYGKPSFNTRTYTN